MRPECCGGTRRATLGAMALRACLLVPLAALALAGCFDSYGPGGPGADGGGSVADAGTIGTDAGGVECGPRALDLACFDHVSAGAPSTISIVAGLGEDCFCDQALACVAAIAGDRVLAITTELCPERPVCRACMPFAEGTCALPALTAGTWRVIVNGETSHDLEVLPPDVLPERGDTCIRRALVDACGATWEPTGFSVSRACHPTGAPPGSRVAIRVHDACGGYQQRGPCEVDVFDDVVRVRATRMPNACDIACPSVCADDEHLCLTPPLRAGEYRLLVDGLAIDEVTTIRVADGAPPDEICAG